MDVENMRKEFVELESVFQEQYEVNVFLQQIQGDFSVYEVELEVWLNLRDIEVNQFKEELEKVIRLIQLE